MNVVDATSAQLDVPDVLSPRVVADPYPVYALYRKRAPVFYSRDVDAWILSRHADVARVLADDEESVTTRYQTTIHGPQLKHMRGEEHRVKRGVVGKHVRGNRAVRTELQQVIESTVAELVAQLPPAPGVADFLNDFARPLPLRVIGHLLAIDDVPLLGEVLDDIVLATSPNVTGDPSVHGRGLAARDRLYDVLKPVVDRRRQCPVGDFISDFCKLEDQGWPIDDEDLQGMTSFLLTAGAETTFRALVSLLRHLALRPEQWKLLVDGDVTPTMVVAEGLRFAPPVHAVFRVLIKDLEIDDVVIPAGARVCVLLASANRDPAVFDNPEDFDVGRSDYDVARTFVGTAQQMTFGGGAHFCIGSILAQIELEVAVRGLAHSFARVALAGDVPPEVGFILRSPERLELLLEPVPSAAAS